MVHANLIGQILPFEPKGNVKQMSFIEYSIESIKGDKIIFGAQSEMQEVYQLNNKNQVIKVIKNELHDSFYSETNYVYDSKGNLVEKSTRNKYDEKQSEKFVFNENSELILQNIFRGGTLERFYKYNYFNNHLSQKEEYDGNNILIRTYKYEYDSNWNKTKCTWISNGLIELEIFKFDSLNRRISYELFSSSKYIYTYLNESELIEKEEFFKAKTLQWTKIYLYDSNKKIKQIDFKDNKNNSTRINKYQYKYDSIGNLIEEIYIENDNPKYAKIYEIKYFK